MATEHQYFYEDEVYRINRKGVIEFGMVLENSELVSGDEGSDTEDKQKMKKGHIRVAWHPTGLQEVVQEKKVRLADRSLMPGDVVRRLIKGKDTQRGYCRNVQVQACAQVVGTKQVLTDVSSKDLVPVEDFSPDVAVCMNSWVGTIKSVNTNLRLAFADGSKCIITDMDAITFEEADERRSYSYSDSLHRSDFHPGQVLQGPASALEDADWIVCMKETKAIRGKPFKNVKVVVEAIETDSVSVHWQCRAFSPNGWCVVDGQPPYVIRGEDLHKLKLLNVFESCTLQIGDRMFYTVKETDKQITKEQWRAEQKRCHDPAPQASGLVGTLSRKRKGSRVYPNATDTPLSQSPEPDLEDVLMPESGPKELEVPRVEPPTGNVVSMDDWETGEADDTGSVSSGCSSNSSAGGGGGGGRRAGGKKKTQPGLMTKVLKLTKLRRSRRKAPNAPVKPNTKVVVEALVTSSTADVVWQDGNVETGIPSAQLYPIHHLDDQEFFPGDFVTENKDDGCLRVYGVVQSVDHAGRMAVVNWFHTYTSNDERQPTQLDRKEVSVYDLKDHPDFQYRPGTVAIRVANFEKPDESCTAGQVLDNYPEGRVHVWWVDGHESLCWPQDLYRVGDYDSDEGDLWDDGSSENSWETECEDSDEDNDPVVDEAMKPRLAANIEKARVAMSRLEELFTQNPSLQTIDIMKKLLEVYKDCRYLDKLMGTSFFHESHFQGLLERVREKGRASVGQKVAEQVSRLFQTSVPIKGEEGVVAVVAEETKVLEFNELNNAKTKEMTANGQVAEEMERVSKTIDSLNVTLDKRLMDQRARTEGNSEDDISNSNSTSTEKSPGSINGHLVQSSSADDSGVFDHSGFSADVSASHDNCDCFSRPNTQQSKSEEKKATYIFGAMSNRSLHNSAEKRGRKFLSQQLSMTSYPEHMGGENDPNTKQVCAKLCSLIMSQLVKAHAEVTRRFNVTQTLPADDEDGEVDESAKKNQEVTKKEETKPPKQTKQKKQKEEKVQTEENVDTDDTPEGREEKTDSGDSGESGTQGFSVMGHAPNGHKYKLTMCQAADPALFFKTVRKELSLLRNALPSGIWVKGFEDRMDLYSIMIRGPERTPYEDGLFLFDVQLPNDYPRAPPLCHYLSYCSDRLNPNLYEDGKVCVSLLGTWSGKGTEVWTLNSNLLQVIVSIQGLILVSEPYFNEAGYEKQKGSQQGRENSRMYNEMAILKLLQAMTKMLSHPPEVFREEIKTHFAQHSVKLLARLEKWLDISEKYNARSVEEQEKDNAENADEAAPGNPSEPADTDFDSRNLQWQKSAINMESAADQPEFPLLPGSRGFCLTLRKALAAFRSTFDTTSAS